MIWFLLIATGITILVVVLKRLWPHIKKSFEDNWHLFKLAFDGLIKILSGIWDVIKAVFRGDIGGVFKAFFGKILPGILELLGNLVGALFMTLGGIVWNIIKGVVNWVADSWVGKMFNLDRHKTNAWDNVPIDPGLAKGVKGMAGGGLVTKGGLFMVGERGAELVSLPTGARVHSNQQSAGMGNTFNINVSGHMGASDAELRQLADKLGNEINKRINRTASSPTGF